MPNKPTTVPRLDTNQTNRTIPAPTKVTDGYLTDDVFPAANANYLHGWAGDWLAWLDDTFEDGLAPGDLRINGILGLEDTPLTGGNIPGKFAVQYDADPADNVAAAVFQVDVKSLTANRNATAIGAEAYNSDTADVYDVSWLAGVWSEAGISTSGTGDVADTDCFAGWIVNMNAAGNMTGDSCVFRAWGATATGTIAKLYGLRVDALTEGTVNYGAWLGTCSPGYSLWIDGGAVELGPGKVTMTATGGSPWTGQKLQLNDYQAALPSNAGSFAANTTIAGYGAGTNTGLWVCGTENTTPSGSAGYAYVFWAEYDADHGGSITDCDVYGGGVYKDGSGTLTNGSTFRAWNGSNTGGGTFANQYGLYVDDMQAASNNYGVYVKGASTYAIWVDSGESRFDGNVACGATNPDTPLHVWASDVRAPAGGVIATFEKNDACVLNLLSSNASGKFGGIWFGDVDAAATGRLEYYQDIDRMDFWTANVRRAVLLSNGRLGVGQNFTDPDALFHVQASSASVDPVGGTIGCFEYNGSGYLSVLTSTGGVGGLVVGRNGDNDAGSLIYDHTDDEWWFYTASNLRMRLTDVGRLGIGVDPSELLHVGGNIRADGDVYVVGAYKSGASKTIPVHFIDAVPENQTVWTSFVRTEATGSLSFRNSSAISIYKQVTVPLSGTITAVSVRLSGSASHNFRIRIFKKDYTATGPTTTTTVADANYASTPLDISAANGTVVSLTVSSGAVAANDVLFWEILNVETGTNLQVYQGSITITTDDVTVSKS